MSEHTSGPWHVHTATRARVVDFPMIASGEGDGLRLIAEMIWSYEERGWTPEDEANTRLIAAAPDLLEACESAAKYIGQDFETYEAAVFALWTISGVCQDAAAKARGETP